jgi:hypothetical protein
VAPDAALLLDTGRFALRVRRGTRLASGGFDDSAADAVSWTCGLDGLSVAATSASPCPGLRPAAGMPLGPLPTHRSNSSTATAGSPAIGAEQRLWVLAHAQTNLSIRNGGGAEPAAWDSGGDGATARAAEAWWRGDGTRLALTLRQTDAQAYPGSVACLAALLRHYAVAYASYRQERRALGLDVARLDRALTRVVETGRTASQGRIRRQAPEIIQDLVVRHASYYASATRLSPTRLRPARPYLHLSTAALAITLPSPRRIVRVTMTPPPTRPNACYPPPRPHTLLAAL